MSAILSQQDLDVLYSRIIKDGGAKSKGVMPPMEFDSPESEANFKRLIFEEVKKKKKVCLPVVIHQAPHEAEAVKRLARFCLELDGTVIHEFQRLEEPAGMVYPENANDSFRWVAGLMRGKPFIWIEADCVPLKAGWAQALTDEYYRQSKEYLYPLQFNPPHDVFAGIGVQGPNAYEHAPVGEKRVGFDEVIVRQHPELIGHTELIRHSYGTYDEKGDVTLHEFPRDLVVVGDKAVLFHKDKKQGLMNIVLPGRGFEV